jgi:hypothetical protein
LQIRVGSAITRAPAARLIKGCRGGGEVLKSMIPKSGFRFPACAKPRKSGLLPFDASAGEGRSEKIMLNANEARKSRVRSS